MTNETHKTRQEKREERLSKKKGKMPQHGKTLGKVYKDAVEKRTKEKELLPFDGGRLISLIQLLLKLVHQAGGTRVTDVQPPLQK